MDKPILIFKTSDVARLANIEQKRFEHWLERENIYLDGIAFRPGENKHRRFSRVDVLRVAIMGRLNDYGITPLKVASRLAEEVVDPYGFRTGNADSIPIESRVDIIFHTLRELKTFFLLNKETGEWKYGGYIERADGSREYFGDEIVGRWVTYLELDAYLTINMQAVMKTYGDRLKEHPIEMSEQEFKSLKSQVDELEKTKEKK